MCTERHSKRLRASSPPTLDDGRDCYLDTLPHDVVRIVLRSLSRRPRHENWHAYVSPFSVYTALGVGGTLARAASSEFKCIGGEDGLLFGNKADEPMLRTLAHRLPLHRLVLQHLGREFLPDLLRGCGAELRELVLDPVGTGITDADIHAISTHCTQLSYLAIRGYYVESPLAPIWRSLGSTLTRIYLGFYGSSSGSGWHTLSRHRIWWNIA